VLWLELSQKHVHNNNQRGDSRHTAVLA